MRLRRRKHQPQAPEADEYGYNFADAENRPWDHRGPGHVRDTAGINSVVVAMTTGAVCVVAIAVYLVKIFLFNT